MSNRKRLLQVIGMALFPFAFGSTLAANEPFTRFAILTDHSMSASDSSTPPVQPSDVKSIVQFCIAHGCEMGVFAVGARAVGGLLRLYIDAPTPRPAPPERGDHSLFEQRKELLKYSAALQQWAEAESARQNRATADAQKFEAQLPFFLLAPRTEHFSDVVNALVRIDRFLMEPPSTPGIVVHRMFLICSDLKETRTGQIYTLASEPIAAWVYRERPQRIPGLNPTMFEAVSPAISWLISQARFSAVERASR